MSTKSKRGRPELGDDDKAHHVGLRLTNKVKDHLHDIGCGSPSAAVAILAERDMGADPSWEYVIWRDTPRRRWVKLLGVYPTLKLAKEARTDFERRAKESHRIRIGTRRKKSGG